MDKGWAQLQSVLEMEVSFRRKECILRRDKVRRLTKRNSSLCRRISGSCEPSF